MFNEPLEFRITGDHGAWLGLARWSAGCRGLALREWKTGSRRTVGSEERVQAKNRIAREWREAYTGGILKVVRIGDLRQ
jgi:hypothetical protein